MSAKMMVVMLVVLGAVAFQMVAPQGTTENIKQVFQGRCWDYEVTRYKNLLPRVETNCDYLWEVFSSAFSFRKPCEVKQDQYKDFLDLAKQNLPVDKVMFWSGAYNLAHQYADNGARLITLEDTLIGYLANSLRWCGQESFPGMNFTQCPEWSDCPTEASESFWAGASVTFASQARGKVTLMVDGSNPNKPAYRKDSFFGKYELPNLNAEKITAVNVIVAHVLGEPKVEVCGTGSLITLRKDVTAKGMRYSCVDDPEIVVYLLCAESPDSPECVMPPNSDDALPHKPKNRSSNRS